MTRLLETAFERASRLPGGLQDELAAQLLEDIEGELKWAETLAGSQDELERLADQALADYRAGRTRAAGFDEL